MTMGPGLRKTALTLHVATSVGWLGAVVCFLVLALAGLNGDDPLAVRACYLAADLVTRAVIVPLCLASLLTGIVQALGTPWGLFQHYWVLIKLALTLLATLLLLVHTRPIGEVARAAAEAALSDSDLHSVRARLAGDAGAAVLALLLANILSVFKPKGLTRYGWLKQQEARSAAPQ